MYDSYQYYRHNPDKPRKGYYESDTDDFNGETAKDGLCYIPTSQEVKYYLYGTVVDPIIYNLEEIDIRELATFINPLRLRKTYDEKSERFDSDMFGFDFIDKYIEVVKGNRTQYPEASVDKLIERKFPYHKLAGWVLSKIHKEGYKMLSKSKCKSQLTHRKGVRKYQRRESNWHI